MITLNGQNGGGQILRTALSLSMITGEAFHIQNIRGLRKKPGLMRQHLTCVLAAAEVSGASVDGAELGSEELIFNPQKIKAGEYHFKIGTAGSTSLLAQTIIPALLQAEVGSTMTLEGGTHNPLAPSTCFLEHIFLPQLKRMGVDVRLELQQHGFTPAGGGRVVFTVMPSEKLEPLHLVERGNDESRQIFCHLAHVDHGVSQREIKKLADILGWNPSCAKVIDASDALCSGNSLSAMVHYENISECVTAHGAYGRSSEQVAKTAAKGMNDYVKSGAVVGRHLGDQLLLPMVLAGAGSMITTNPTNHIITNISTIQSFLDVKIDIKEHLGHLYLITVS